MSTIRSNRDFEATGASELDDLLQLRELAETPTVERAVEAVRKFLDMDVAYSSEFVGDKQVFRAVRGDSASFGIEPGESIELQHSYCERVLGGRLPNLIPDTRKDDRAASLAVTAGADVRAFVSIPLRFCDGRLYGTLCAASHEPKPSMGYRELQFLHVFARLISDQLELDQLARQSRGLEMQAAGCAGSDPDTPLIQPVTQPDLYKRVSDARGELLDVIGSIDAAAHERAEDAEIRNELEDDLLLAANRLGRVAQRLLARPDRPS